MSYRPSGRVACRGVTRGFSTRPAMPQLEAIRGPFPTRPIQPDMATTSTTLTPPESNDVVTLHPVPADYDGLLADFDDKQLREDTSPSLLFPQERSTVSSPATSPPVPYKGATSTAVAQPPQSGSGAAETETTPTVTEDSAASKPPTGTRQTPNKVQFPPHNNAPTSPRHEGSTPIDVSAPSYISQEEWKKLHFTAYGGGTPVHPSRCFHFPLVEQKRRAPAFTCPPEREQVPYSWPGISTRQLATHYPVNDYGIPEVPPPKPGQKCEGCKRYNLHLSRFCPWKFNNRL